MTQIETERLIIRDPLLSDIDGWHRLLSDVDAMYYLQDIMTHSLDESRENLKAAVDDVKNTNRTKYFFTIEGNESKTFIGTVGYTVTDTTSNGKLVWAGYFILPEYHGKGYMTEAFQEVIRYAFENNDVYKISTGCFLDNKASERVMQKCGMIKEDGRDACVWHDGRMKDRVEYRLLRDEWTPERCYSFI